MVKIIFTFLIFFILNVHAESPNKKRIFILHSYSQEYGWTKSQHESFVSNIQQSVTSPLEFSVEYLDTKRHPYTSSYQQFFLSYLQKKYEGYRPDAIYVTDDNALLFFLNNRSMLFDEVPLFFSGVNDLTLEQKLDTNHFAGVYETKDILPNIELVRQFSPQTRDIWFIGDNSSTYHAIEADIKDQIRQYPNYLFHFIASDHMDTIVQNLPRAPRSFVFLTTIGGFNDKNGRNLTPKESISLLSQNTNIILLSLEDSYLMGNVVGGFVTSGKKQGMSAAELMRKSLEGESVSNIHSILKSPNVYMFDRKALVRSRLILSEYTARKAIILHENKTFFEKHQEGILNVVFIMAIIIFLFLLFLFFILRQKKEQIKKLASELENCSSEFSLFDNKFSKSEMNNE